MFRFIFTAFLLVLCLVFSVQAQVRPPFEDNMAQRTLACVACHGKEGRAGPDAYYPRLAGKPVAYLYKQLLNFRDGRRHYGLMTGLVAPLSDAYLMEIAQHFSKMDLPYPPPQVAVATKAVLTQGRLLVTQGDSARKLPACVECHGQALTGVAPDVPGLLGLSSDYLNAQLGGWKTGQRRAHAPDCMAQIATQLSTQDVASVAHWLASQPLPANTHPVTLALRPYAAPPKISCGSAPPVNTPQAQGSQDKPRSAAVAQGEYLARVGNCMACHTPPGGDAFAGGRAIATPFGTAYASNLTPDPRNGLGLWSADDFWQAMHHGRSKDGRLLNPAFPYVNFTQMTRADSDALFAYFQSLTPRQNKNRPHEMRWPFGTQTALRAWRTLFFTPGVYQVQAQQSAQWNRGAYLVQGLGHCAACHTPRNVLGAAKHAADWDGGMISMQSGYAPSLRSALEAGVQQDNADGIFQLLKTGIHAGGAATGLMAEVVQSSTQYMTDDDLKAMVVFLKTIMNPARPEQKIRVTENDTLSTSSGAKLYERHCAQCHGEQGEGIAGAYPPLAKNRATMMNNPSNIVQMVLYGGFAPTTSGNPRPYGMPPYVLQMNDKETASVLNYIRNAWGNQATTVTELDVSQARERP